MSDFDQLVKTLNDLGYERAGDGEPHLGVNLYRFTRQMWNEKGYDYWHSLSFTASALWTNYTQVDDAVMKALEAIRAWQTAR